ncbi:MAG: agmatine deiminase family protein [Bacteroidia bacterium]
MIKPEYTDVKELFLVYPKGFKDTTETLNNFYLNLISLIPEEITQYVIVNNQQSKIELDYRFSNKKVIPVLIEGFNELWLRDLMGINCGFNKIIKPTYKPDYCEYLYPKSYLLEIEKQVGEIFQKTIGANLIKMPLVLDGGNFVSNGKYAFLTDKVISQNSENVNEIKKILKGYLNVEPIILETSKTDKLGHTDGYLNFLNSETLCVSKYPQIQFLKDDIEYSNKLKEILIPFNFKLIDIYDRPVAEKVVGGGQFYADKSDECLNSARGIFINFLILNKTIILPEYTLPNYKKTMDYNSTNKFTLEKMGYKVKSINCDEISKLGGSLHCISFTN